MVEVFVESRPEGLGELSEEAAFADLYNRTYAPLVAYCRRYCPPGYDAEDIAQEALSRAWSSWDRYSPSRPFWPWVATIARRLCVDYWRRDERAIARAGGATVLEPIAQPRPDELSEAADECRMALKAFRGLRPDHQRMVGLRDIEGWSYEDIARFEGVTVESVRGALRRARMSLRKSYESLSKTAVPVLVPVVFLRRFQLARARFATRVARWHATLSDAGMASGRFGEALASLMALSVAAVGLGAPTPVAVAAADNGGSSSLTPSSPAPPAPAGSNVQPTASSVTSHATEATGQNVDAPWVASSGEWKPADLLVPAGGGSDIKDSQIRSITFSPNFNRDGTVFASGFSTGACGVCARLFRSSDGGRTWVSLRALGMTGDRVLLSPAYPSDSRIFVTDGEGLELSIDGGATFVPVAATSGIAVMSPAFSSGDPRILLADTPGRQYDDRLHATTPLDLKPDSTLVSQGFSFAFPTAYDPAAPVMYISGSRSSVDGGPSTVTRCVGTVCGSAVALPGTIGAPFLAMGRNNGRDVLYARNGRLLFRSIDAGATFTELALPASVTNIIDATFDTAGNLYLVTSNAKSNRPEVWRTFDAGATWMRVPTQGIPSVALATVQPLPDGTLLVGLNDVVAGVACSHDDGQTWAQHC